MTVLFNIRDATWPEDGDGARCPPAEMFLNVANTNARDFLDWLGLSQKSLCDEMPAPELAALLRRRLWPARRDLNDEGHQRSETVGTRGAHYINMGREPGRLAEYAERLLALAEFAADRTVIWY